jgi:hypothetical protein
MNKLILPFLLLFTSCEKERVCDTSLQTHYLYAQDTLEYVKIWDINTDYVLYSDSNVIGPFKLVDDSYFNFIGTNSRTTLNLQYRFPKDSVYGRFVGLCVFTDECHVYYSMNFDTIKR